jgi:hypothetical protein
MVRLKWWSFLQASVPWSLQNNLKLFHAALDTPPLITDKDGAAIPEMMASARLRRQCNVALSDPSCDSPNKEKDIYLNPTRPSFLLASHECAATMLQWLTLLILPLVAISSWLYTAGVAKSKFPSFRNKRVCLLIAHPDDEAMFFAPTLLALTEPSLGNHVKILCLSSGKAHQVFPAITPTNACAGDADGLGETRKKELVKSGMLLGLRKEDDVFVVESSFVLSAALTFCATDTCTGTFKIV